MGLSAVQNLSESFRQSSFRLSTKNAWAKYVRNRWQGQNLVKATQAEWGLSEGKARGLVYAQATQTTIDEVLAAEDRKRPFGAFRLGLTILELQTQTALEGYIRHQADEARREKIEREARERLYETLHADLPDLRRLDGQERERLGPGRGAHAHLGGSRDQAPVGETSKTFAPDRRRP